MLPRLLCFYAIALIVFTAFQARVVAADLKVFIFAGQANMVGKAKASDLPQSPEDFRLPQRDVLFAAREAESHVEPVNETGSNGNPWTVLQPVEGTFGPEISFGRTIVDHLPQSKIAIVKVACPETTLAEDWNPEAKKGLQLYPAMLDFLRLAVARREKAGDKAQIAGLIWYQGEADSHDEAMAKAYQENLRRFFSHVRTDLKAPELPVVAVRIGLRERDPGKYEPIVRSAIEEVCGSDSHEAWISVDGLELLDGQHLSSASEIEAGKRLAAAWLKLASQK